MVADRLASASSDSEETAGPDPFQLSHWTRPMIEAWVVYRDADAVRDAAGEGQAETIANLAAPPKLYAEIQGACSDIDNAVGDGRLACIGKATSNPNAVSKLIPPDEMAGLKLSWDFQSGFPGAVLKPRDQPLATDYHSIRYRRREVISLWPAKKDAYDSDRFRIQKLDYSQIEPDVAKEPYWNASQAITWLMYHDIDHVRALFNTELHMESDDTEIISAVTDVRLQEYAASLADQGDDEIKRQYSLIEDEVQPKFNEACSLIISYCKAG